MEEKKIYKLSGKRKVYILSFDRDDLVDYKRFHNELIALPEIITWWHYIKSSYIIISQHRAKVLVDKINKISPKKKLLLIEVDLKNMNGWLPREAWDWLDKEKAKIDTGNVPPIA